MIANAIGQAVWGFMIAGFVQIVCGSFNSLALVAAPAIMGFIGLCDRSSQVVIIQTKDET